MTTPQLQKELQAEINRIEQTRYLAGTIYIELPEPQADNYYELTTEIDKILNNLQLKKFTRQQNKLFHTSRNLTIVIIFS